MMIKHFDVYKQRVERHLEQNLQTLITPSKLKDAMHYGVFNGGKRIRPLLCYLSAEALQCPLERVDSIASAIELIHCYSLIHDDLPAMDDDDLRRGLPTVHIKFDEATAILAGDALQTLAFECLLSDTGIDPTTKLTLLALLTKASGSMGMVAGQVMDLSAENTQISKSELKEMHERKTGDLISCSVMTGALLGHANSEQTAGLQSFAYALGLAFQVRDDILDEIGDTAVMGKQQGSDAGKVKSTFVSAYGLEGAQEYLTNLQKVAHEALLPLGDKGANLRSLCDFIIQRDH